MQCFQPTRVVASPLLNVLNDLIGILNRGQQNYCVFQVSLLVTGVRRIRTALQGQCAQYVRHADNQVIRMDRGDSAVDGLAQCASATRNLHQMCSVGTFFQDGGRNVISDHDIHDFIHTGLRVRSDKSMHGAIPA